MSPGRVIYLDRDPSLDITKRAFDLIAACAGVLVLGPLLLFVAILIRSDSSGPIFHRGLRVGKGGKQFRIYKFRTMVADAAVSGPRITIADDRRVTRIGHMLRKTKLDELPQLLNVIKGEMSLVGPRPEDPAFVALYSGEQRAVLSVRPGVTSPASLHYRSEEALLRGSDWRKVYLEEILPRKLEIELDYLKRCNILTDITLIVRTVLVVFPLAENAKSNHLNP